MNTLAGLLTLLSLQAPLQTPLSLDETHLWSHEHGERFHQPASLSLATGDVSLRDSKALHPWPVKVLSIGHTNASYQCYSGLSTAYFHHGLDIRADAGSDVFASVGGKVVNIENYVPGVAAYWEVAILDDDGFLWQYHHIERASIPQAIHDAYKTGAKISTGTKIGEVFSWAISTFGEYYHHVHLNILGKDKAYLSPFLFLEKLPDTQSPIVGDISLVKGGSPIQGNTVSGPYTIMAELKDLIMHQKFIVPPHETVIRIDNGPAQIVWKFETLPGGADQKGNVFDFYMKGITCGDYGCRKPIVNLGFSKTDKIVFPESKGNHELEIEIRDFNGNVGTKKFSWSVQ